MTRQKIREMVIDEISNISGIPSEDIGENSRMDEDLAIDSLDAVEIICDFERDFSISISDDELNNIKALTVGDVVSLIEHKIS